MDLNRAILAGNLTRDPEERSLPSGAKVCNFSIATNRVWKDKDGSQQKSTDFHNIVVFGRQAETSAQYLKKGQEALIEGRIQTRSWDDQKTGEKKYRTEIVADRVQFGSRGTGAGSAPSGADQSASNDSSASQGAKEEGEIDYPDEEIDPEDIPF
ncbi:MAG: single-stranded DNA-binding protein [Patescibacteria group bacterium]